MELLRLVVRQMEQRPAMPPTLLQPSALRCAASSLLPLLLLLLSATVCRIVRPAHPRVERAWGTGRRTGTSRGCESRAGERR